VKYEPLPLSSPNLETQRGLFLWLTMPTNTSRYLVPQALLLESRYDLQKTRDILTISSSCCAFSIALSSLLFLTFSISAYI
jgi:hypothetical protein